MLGDPERAFPEFTPRHARCLGSATRGPFGIWAADLAWRHRPGRAIVLSLETAGGPFGVSYVLDSGHLESIEHQSIVLGIERSLPDAGVGPYMQFGAGLGRVTTDSFERSNGLALSGAAGLRIVPRRSYAGSVHSRMRRTEP